MTLLFSEKVPRIAGLFWARFFNTWFTNFMVYGSTTEFQLCSAPLLLPLSISLFRSGRLSCHGFLHSCRLLGLIQQTQPAGPGGAGDRNPVFVHPYSLFSRKRKGTPWANRRFAHGNKGSGVHRNAAARDLVKLERGKDSVSTPGNNF